MTETSKTPEVREIAAISRDIFTIPLGNILLNQDDTLATRGGGKGLKLYDEIERDAHAYAVLQKRKLAVVARPWDVTPASQSRRDKQAAELVRAALAGIQFDRFCADLLDATLKGFAVAEVMPVVREGAWMIGDVKPRDQRRFVFGWDGRPRLLTASALVEGEELPARKFIVHRYGAKDGSPYGLGLGSRLFWPVWFKRQDMKFWLTFADKFGSPTTVGKYPVGAQQAEQDKLLQALEAIAQEGRIIIPEGMLIELLEAQRSGAGDFYERLARYCDEQISEAVLGETMTTSAQGAGLGSNQASVHNEVRTELAQADADLLSDTLNATLVAWLIDWNLPGAGYPKVYRDFREPEDTNELARRDQILVQMGWAPSEQYIQDTYGEGWSRAAPPAALRATPGAPMQQFAAPPADEPDTPQLQAAQLAREAAPALRTLVGALQRIVDRAQTLEELRDELVAAYGHLPIEDLQSVMSRAFAAADAAGRFEVARGG